MSGLREKQKAHRHDSILRAAATLFREHGYEAVKMEAIAAAAEVSTGTIYNYYQNKGDLLVAIVSMEVNEVLAAGERVIADPPSSAERAVAELNATYIEHSLVYLSKEMWRQAMATSTEQPDSPSGSAYSDLDMALADQTCRMVKTLKTKGLVRADVDATAVGELIFNNTNMMFISFVKSPDMTVDDLLKRIGRQVRPLLKAIAA